MDRNTLSESFHLENNQSSHISLIAKNGFLDMTTGIRNITVPLDMFAVEIESWGDLQDKMLNMFNSSTRNEDKQLSVIYQNKLYSRSSSSSSGSFSQESEDEESMYEEIIQTFSLATREEPEVVILPDERAWKKMWKYLKKVLKIRKRKE